MKPETLMEAVPAKPEPTKRKLNRKERRMLARLLGIPLPRKTSFPRQFQRMCSPRTNQTRREVNQIIRASRARSERKAA